MYSQIREVCWDTLTVHHRVVQAWLFDEFFFFFFFLFGGSYFTVFSEAGRMEAVKLLQNKRSKPDIDPLALQVTRDMNLETARANNEMVAMWENEDLAKVREALNTD